MIRHREHISNQKIIVVCTHIIEYYLPVITIREEAIDEGGGSVGVPLFTISSIFGLIVINASSFILNGTLHLKRRFL